MSIATLFTRKRPEAKRAEALFDAIVAQAKTPELRQMLGVPDSIDGQFETLILHAFVVIDRLSAGDEQDQATAQRLYDVMVEDLKASLLELGAGDSGVWRKVRTMTEAFHGRALAYRSALAANDPVALDAALARNLYGTLAPSAAERAAATRYLQEMAARIAAIPSSDLGRMAGSPFVNPLPTVSP